MSVAGALWSVYTDEVLPAVLFGGAALGEHMFRRPQTRDPRPWILNPCPGSGSIA
jgi:hypothetical protein